MYSAYKLNKQGDNIQPSYSFPNLEPVCCSKSGSNCCFLICIKISEEAGQVVWYCRLFKNFPQFVVIHTVKGFGVVNKAEVDIFLELSCFFDDPVDVGNLQLWNEKMLAPWKKSYDQPRQHIKKQIHYFASKGPYSRSYGFSSSHV